MDAFLGEIRPFAFNYVPYGWIACDGSQLPIRQYTALYAVIGINYGGDGITYFKVPDLRGVIANGMGQLHGGNLYDIGEIGGSEKVTLTQSTMPNHKHNIAGANTTPLAQQITKETKSPSALNYLSNLVSQTDNKIGFGYANDTNPTDNVQMGIHSISLNGGSLPHDNMAPYLPITYCICMDGIFPVRS